MRPKPRISASHKLAFSIAVFLICALPVSAAVKYKVLHAFKGGRDGVFPSGALLFDTAGNLYGTTVNGGSNETCINAEGAGCGVIFELMPQPGGKWTESVLYRFQGGSDGGNPNGSLVFDSAGNLYGTTIQGGAGNSLGCGTIFQLTPGSSGWTESLVRTFCSDGANDGYFPRAGLIRDSMGNLFGTTESGGEALGGVAFELTPDSKGWNESVLNSFCLVDACSTLGAQPEAALALDSQGNVYGTTIAGGQTGFACFGTFPPGCGLVFKLTHHSNGRWTESVPHSFDGPDGAGPASSLTFDDHGNLYGTTSYDGAFGFGTVFRLSPDAHGHWIASSLYNFRGSSSQGAINSGLVLDNSGNLYGATIEACCTVVYKLTPEPNGRWKHTVLHRFSGGHDGGSPKGNLILDKNGNLYGAAGTGGDYGGGVVFEITP